VSSLWTPSGEHPTGGDADGHDHPHPGPAAAGQAPGDLDELSPEELEEVEAELRRARAELAAVPVVDIIVNHAVGLWQLAALHLAPDASPDGTPQPPRLAEASLAIDAFAAIVEGLGERLAPHDEAMTDALSQLRLAFVQVAERSGG
jgi:hypothetical protein